MISEAQRSQNLVISLLPGEFAVCRLAPEAGVPDWVGGSLFTVMRTAEELAIVCEASRVPAAVQQAPGWRALKLHGPFDFGLTGVLASVLNPLAAAQVSIFALSTYDTDYVLVPHGQVEPAMVALRVAGHTVLA